MDAHQFGLRLPVKLLPIRISMFVQELEAKALQARTSFSSSARID
jgi:hypothetical protein